MTLLEPNVDHWYTVSKSKRGSNKEFRILSTLNIKCPVTLKRLFNKIHQNSRQWPQLILKQGRLLKTMTQIKCPLVEILMMQYKVTSVMLLIIRQHLLLGAISHHHQMANHHPAKLWDQWPQCHRWMDPRKDLNKDPHLINHKTTLLHLHRENWKHNL